MKKDTIKIAYNDNYAGFILSREAMTWMKEHGYAGKFNSAHGDCVVPRHHPLLVECIETLGEAAAGSIKAAGSKHSYVVLSATPTDDTRSVLVDPTTGLTLKNAENALEILS